ncbi:MAG: methionine sulfoxide reductase [Marmoricola sp.]|nr:methionine sulfoxide reductase [Marmoricola sp.]
MAPKRTTSARAAAAAGLLAFFALSACSGTSSDAPQAATAVPAARVDPVSNSATTAVAVLAGGCFWGVEGVFEHVAGVTDAVSGYAGGSADTAKYSAVTTGETGHAEAVRITYDPRKISYAQLLQIYFGVAHDPTELNRQGPDTGTQYRSAIFPTDAEQASTAKAYIAQLDEAKVFRAPIVTTLEPGKTFYPAEVVHQDFMALYPDNPYIVANDAPKLVALEKDFPQRYRAS